MGGGDLLSPNNKGILINNLLDTEPFGYLTL